MVRFTTASRLALETEGMSFKEALGFFAVFILSNIVLFGGIALALCLAIFAAVALLVAGAFIVEHGGLIGSVAGCVLVIVGICLSLWWGDKKFALKSKEEQASASIAPVILQILILACAIMSIVGVVGAYSRGDIGLLPMMGWL